MGSISDQGRRRVMSRTHVVTPECIEKGALYWIAQARDGSTEGIPHPHLVVQDDVLNRSRLDRIVVCALTTNLGRANEPGNVLLKPGEGGLERQSVVIVSQVASVKKSDFGTYIGKLDLSRVDEVLTGLRFQQRAFFGEGR